MKILEEPVENLRDYATVPIAYEVRSRLRPEPVDSGLGGIRLVGEAVEPPYLVDHDRDGGPVTWLERWDLRNWGVIAALDGLERLGGAVIAWRTPGVNMLDGRDDLAVLWDLRVEPRRRREGVGQALFRAAAEWARARGCTALKVETQNTNLPACRFYARQGCTLAAINTFAYPDEPGEVQLLWRLDL